MDIQPAGSGLAGIPGTGQRAHGGPSPALPLDATAHPLSMPMLALNLDSCGALLRRVLKKGRGSRSAVVDTRGCSQEPVKNGRALQLACPHMRR